MKCVVDGAELRKKLRLCAAAADPNRRGVANVGKMVRMEAEGGALALVCAGEVMGIRAVIPARVLDSGQTCLPVHALKKLKWDSEVVVAADSVGGYSFAASDVGPEMVRFDDVEGDRWEIPSWMLREGLNKVKHVLDDDARNLALRSVLVERDEEVVWFVASDGFRLAARTFALTRDDAPTAMLIPASVVEKLDKLLGECADEVVSIAEGKEHVVLVFPTKGMELSFSRVEARYPSYRSVIPKQPQCTAEIPISTLVKTLRVVETWRRESRDNRTFFVDFSFSEHHLEIADKTAGMQMMVRVELDYPLEVDQFSVKLQPRYVLEAVEAMASFSPVVEFCYHGGTEPVLLRCEEDALELIMPGVN